MDLLGDVPLEKTGIEFFMTLKNKASKKANTSIEFNLLHINRYLKIEFVQVNKANNIVVPIKECDKVTDGNGNDEYESITLCPDLNDKNKLTFN